MSAPTLTFHGAAGTVTGSCFEIACGKRRLLVDCGLFQGPRSLEALNYQPFGFDPAAIDAVLLTHAHLDHSGLLPRLAAEFADLELSVHEEQTDHIVAELLAGRLDVVLLALPAPAQGVTELPLYDEDFVLVTPASFELDAEGVPREALNELDVILLNEGHCLRDQALDVCREVGARAPSATYATSLATLVQLVSGGLGVTLVPETALPVETRRAPNLSLHRFADPAPFRRIGLGFRSTSPRAEEFEALAAGVRAAIAELGTGSPGIRPA